MTIYDNKTMQPSERVTMVAKLRESLTEFTVFTNLAYYVYNMKELDRTEMLTILQDIVHENTTCGEEECRVVADYIAYSLKLTDDEWSLMIDNGGE